MRLRTLDGKELSEDRTYTLVTSNYRATGTGGYPEIGKSPVIQSTTDEMPDLLADYLRKNSPVRIPENAKFAAIW